LNLKDSRMNSKHTHSSLLHGGLKSFARGTQVFCTGGLKCTHNAHTSFLFCIPPWKQRTQGAYKED
jgi:hypothetical protein